MELMTQSNLILESMMVLRDARGAESEGAPPSEIEGEMDVAYSPHSADKVACCVAIDHFIIKRTSVYLRGT